MAELVKRQHFVPRTYLKHFGELKKGSYQISVIPPTASNDNEIFVTNIQNIALERNLYTLPGETDAQKMAVETFYANNYEQHYDQIYDILTDENRVQITAEERKLIISTVVTMYYRTTKWINNSKDLMKRVFESVYQLCEHTGKDYFQFEGEKISIAGKTLEQFTKEYNDERQPGMIIIQLETALKLISLRLKNDAIMVVKLGNDEDHFITSDNPVIARNMSDEKFMPFDPQNILKLPLDSKHMLMLIPEGGENKQQIFRTTSTSAFGTMEKICGNDQQMNNSEKFIFGSDASLKSFLKDKSFINSLPNL